MTQENEPQSSATKPLLAVGNWSFAIIPSDWEIVDQHGIRLTLKDTFPSNVVVTEESLPEGQSLGAYIDAQTAVLQHYVSISELSVEPQPSPTIAGSSETTAVLLHFVTPDGSDVVQRQMYVRARQFVGIVTLTTTEADLKSADPAFQTILMGLTFLSS